VREERMESKALAALQMGDNGAQGWVEPGHR
jgi:hypothetical protein